MFASVFVRLRAARSPTAGKPSQPVAASTNSAVASGIGDEIEPASPSFGADNAGRVYSAAARTLSPSVEAVRSRRRTFSGSERQIADLFDHDARQLAENHLQARKRSGRFWPADKRALERLYVAAASSAGASAVTARPARSQRRAAARLAQDSHV